MTKHLLLATCMVLATASVASAGGSAGSVGVGGEFALGAVSGGTPGASSIGLGGISVNYDVGEFHLGGFLGFADGAGDDNTNIYLGGRFYYHVHSTAMADFGIGGSVSLGSIDHPDPMDRDLLLFIEPGFQIRAFVASNVALSFTGGLSLGVADADGVAVSAQPSGVAGFHYYFF